MWFRFAAFSLPRLLFLCEQTSVPSQNMPALLTQLCYRDDGSVQKEQGGLFHVQISRCPPSLLDRAQILQL